MKRLITKRIPGLAMVYMCVILFSSIINIQMGTDAQRFCRYTVEVWVFCLALELIYWGLGQMGVSRKKYFRVLAFVAGYAAWLICSTAFGWISLRDRTMIVLCSLGFAGIYVFVDWYFGRILKIEAKEINDLIVRQPGR